MMFGFDVVAMMSLRSHRKHKNYLTTVAVVQWNC